MRVSTAEFIERYGDLADRALAEPITITKNGRDRLVVISASEYARLKSRDREVLGIGDFSEEDVAAIAAAEPPAEATAYDTETDGWRG